MSTQTPAQGARGRPAIQTAIPEWTRRITLNTAYAQRVFRRVFERLKADLYVLTVRTRANGLEDAAAAIETQLSEEFERVGKDLNGEIERVDHILNGLSVADAPSYKLAETHQATFSTPRANEYLNLLVRMDTLLMRYDALWLTGNIETHVRVDNSINWQRRLTKIANRLRDRGNQARAKLEQVYHERSKPRPRRNGAASEEGAAGEAAAASSEEALLADDDHDLLPDPPVDAAAAFVNTGENAVAGESTEIHASSVAAEPPARRRSRTQAVG